MKVSRKEGFKDRQSSRLPVRWEPAFEGESTGGPPREIGRPSDNVFLFLRSGITLRLTHHFGSFSCSYLLELRMQVNDVSGDNRGDSRAFEGFFVKRRIATLGSRM
jgi:hypothetical protein